jgi:hypothetical protein
VILLLLIEGNIRNIHLWKNLSFAKSWSKLVPSIIQCPVPKNELNSGSGSEAGEARRSLQTEHRSAPNPAPQMPEGRRVRVLPSCQDVSDN